MIDVTLTDLIDVATLQEIQDGFANLTGMAALTTDASGTAVTQGSNFTDFCMKYTRRSRVGCARCEECDRMGGEKTMRTGCAAAYFCHAGLVDFAAPILLDGQFIGSFIGGQVLTEAPDEAKFRKIAEEINVNPDDYIRALKKIKIMDKKQIDAAADFLFIIAKILSQTAYNNYLTVQTSAGLDNMNHEVMHKIDEAEVTVEKITEKINLLSEAFDSVSRIEKESASEVAATKDTLKVIQDIAMNTKILGFNASIEASRARENGKGFGVIAQEVRTLAETSKSSADRIEQAMQRISSHSKDMSRQVAQTKEVVEQCIDKLHEFSTMLDEIKNIKME
ncbi:MAG: PocR ligand-binding domain-containing protein [Oscillospiraceae bacterium]|nr:PocR ligand-binding domain-containing protein [Oscillospiraceae bacterium]